MKCHHSEQSSFNIVMGDPCSGDDYTLSEAKCGIENHAGSQCEELQQSPVYMRLRSRNELRWNRMIYLASVEITRTRTCYPLSHLSSFYPPPPPPLPLSFSAR